LEAESLQGIGDRVTTGYERDIESSSRRLRVQPASSPRRSPDAARNSPPKLFGDDHNVGAGATASAPVIGRDPLQATDDSPRGPRPPEATTAPHLESPLPAPQRLFHDELGSAGQLVGDADFGDEHSLPSRRPVREDRQPQPPGDADSDVGEPTSPDTTEVSEMITPTFTEACTRSRFADSPSGTIGITGSRRRIPRRRSRVDAGVRADEPVARSVITSPLDAEATVPLGLGEPTFGDRVVWSTARTGSPLRDDLLGHDDNVTVVKLDADAIICAMSAPGPTSGSPRTGRI